MHPSFRMGWEMPSLCVVCLCIYQQKRFSVVEQPPRIEYPCLRGVQPKSKREVLYVKIAPFRDGKEALSATMSYNYIVTAHKPTAVTSCLTGTFALISSVG